ncbi:chromate resistance protein ChrB domain-containing protein [Acinetobacter sp.]|uniref:chromate resistance protein ChrB domain-containing protein n=1 Tax=Acinetobacter sp. TaxID=472 RepID=UPI00258FFF01|nr:chromate resistance protein ChrB domain-containing protein [Acinetobacter sp.]
MEISILISSLPTQNTTTRMRVWRSIKASGAAILRDGVYLLPISHTKKFEPIANDINSEQGTAYVFHAELPLDFEIAALFNRKKQYDGFYKQLSELKNRLSKEEKKDLLKQIRKLRKSIDALIEIDYYPDETQIQVANELSALELLIARFGEANEPLAIHAEIQGLDKENYQNKTWATRKRPWIDRLASAWLIKTFIDTSPAFIWLETPADCPKDAIGFDFDGATFSHVKHWVTFEVLLYRFNLDTPALQKIAEIVHYLDVGGVEPPEAIGIERVIQGIRSQMSEDDQLFALSNHIFDGLYADLSRE